MCIECQNSFGSIITHDNFKIQQERDCGSALTGSTIASPLADQTVAFLADAALVTKATGHGQFFLNSYQSACGVINACYLMVAGCGSAYAGSNLAITAATGAVTAK